METSSRGEAAALAAEFRAEVAAHEPSWQPDPAWAFRLALAVESLTSATVVPLSRSSAPSGRRLCAHADDDGRGMHWLAPGEVCGRAPGVAERQARVTAASAVLADFVRWTAGDTLGTDTARDWMTWADRLSQHLAYVIDAVSQ